MLCFDPLEFGTQGIGLDPSAIPCLPCGDRRGLGPVEQRAISICIRARLFRARLGLGARSIRCIEACLHALEDGVALRHLGFRGAGGFSGEVHPTFGFRHLGLGLGGFLRQPLGPFPLTGGAVRGAAGFGLGALGSGERDVPLVSSMARFCRRLECELSRGGLGHGGTLHVGLGPVALHKSLVSGLARPERGASCGLRSFHCLVGDSFRMRPGFGHLVPLGAITRCLIPERLE